MTTPPTPAPPASAPSPALPRSAAKRQPSHQELQERRIRLRQFIEAYREVRDGLRPTERDIAIASYYRNRSAVAKYLSGEASDACVSNIEKTLAKSADEFDAGLEKQMKRLAARVANPNPTNPG
jgi:hypothetical protein